MVCVQLLHARVQFEWCTPFVYIETGQVFIVWCSSLTDCVFFDGGDDAFRRTPRIDFSISAFPRWLAVRAPSVAAFFNQRRHFEFGARAPSSGSSWVGQSRVVFYAFFHDCFSFNFETSLRVN